VAAQKTTLASATEGVKGMRIGYVGLGIMGRGMVGNLLKAGHAVVVYNRTAERMQPLVERGATAASSPAQVVAEADITGVCVTDDAAVEAVFGGSDGLLAGLRAGGVVVDHSTISPQQTLRAARAASERGAEWLDAPVTGGDKGAAAGTLTIMVGGSAEGFARIHPYLQAIGKTLVHVGGSGQGQLVKLVNNFIGGIALVGAAEGLLIGLRGGVPLQTMMQVLSAGSADSVSLRLLAERLQSGEQRPGFSLANRLKDMDLALAAARALGACLPVGAVTAELFRERAAAGERDLDQTVVMRRYGEAGTAR